MRRLAVGVVTVLVLALAGCSSSSQPGGSTSSTASSPTTDAPPANPKLFERCGSDGDGISSVPFTFAAGDGTRLFGLGLGGGPRGVVMVHELGSRGLCGWLWYGKYLAAHGLHVLLYDTRCTGSSSCPDGAKTDDVVDELAVPLFYGVATQEKDRLPTARRIVKLATHSAVTLKVIAGPDHGWDLLQDGNGRSTPLAAQVLAFLSAHLR